jgi:hypothetical protein
MVARGMMSGMMMPSALRRVCPCGELLSRAYKSARKWLTSPRTTSTRIEVPMDVDANIIDGANTIDVVDGYAAGRRQRSSAVICGQRPELWTWLDGWARI